MFKSKKVIVSLLASMMLVFGGSSALAAPVFESEPNDTIPTSDYCTTGGDSLCQGAISSTSDVDYWMFYANSSSLTYMFVTSSYSATYYISIYDGTNVSVPIYSGTLSNGNNVYVPGLQQGHTYFVKVQASEPDSYYSMQIF